MRHTSRPAGTTAAVPSTAVATSTSTSTPTTSTPTTSSPTTTAASSTTTEPSTQLPRLLRPDGIGAVDVGMPADETITALTAVLGPPDHDVAILPPGEGGGECVEGAGWADCLEPPPTMWLEPPIGEALGLPADDFVVRALTGSAT